MTDINYIGSFPAFELFNNIYIEEYEVIKNAHGDKEW